jgi:hypothetical protein
MREYCGNIVHQVLANPQKIPYYHRMSAIPTMGHLPRKRGPKGKFASKDAQISLLAFLNDPSKSNLDAAAHFGCSERTIEYALARIRSQINEKSPGPDTARGIASSTMPCDTAAPIVADSQGTPKPKED